MEDEIRIIIYDNKPLVLNRQNLEYKHAEDICTHAANILGIGPVARHLYGLCHVSSRIWLSPCEVLQHNGNREYEFRLRYKLPDVGKLSEVDLGAFNYYFKQVRQDFLKGNIPEIAKMKERALGLAVTDMLRVKLESEPSTELVDNDFTNFLPQEVSRHYKYFLRHFLKKAMKESLTKIEQNRRDVTFVKEQYIKTILELKPSYGCEEYNAEVDEGGHVVQVQLQLDPFHPEAPGLRQQIGNKKAPWESLCSIEELCYISMRQDGTVEISRRNGVPQYFRFHSVAKMKSFVSLMDGYYRLTEKWTFNLCKDLPTPSLLQLKAMKCHGPVGQDFAYNKILEKGQNQKGSYILREHCYSNEYRLDTLTDEKVTPVTFPIILDNSGQYKMGNSLETFSTLQDLINFYSKEMKLKICIPPSEYDKSPLLLCRVQNKDYSSVLKHGNLPLAPVCISIKSISAGGGKDLLHMKNFVIKYGVWHRSPSERHDCMLKSLKCAQSNEHVVEFLQMVDKHIFMHCEAIVTMYGFVLSPPTVVMEYLPVGPLDKYLKAHKNEVQEVDLVEAGTYLAKALWYLEEQNICHGNIRCHNVFVSNHGENSFKVKLADASHPSYSPAQIHWIPIELYGTPELAKTSLMADVWAFGTVLWEIFSYGTQPLKDVNIEEAKQLYLNGTRLVKPFGCHEDVYKLMMECWIKDPDARKKPQAIMRDINQILYEVYNSRRSHAYATISTRNPSVDSSVSSSSSWSNKSTLPATPRGLSKRFNLMNLDENGTEILENGHDRRDSDSTNWSLLSFQSDSTSTPDATDFVLDFSDNDETGNGVKVKQFHLSTSGTSLMSIPNDQEWIIEMNQLELSQRLGQGFYGEVRKAHLTRWSGLEREEVAVKKLRKSCMGAGMQDLLREISIMKALQHKNIVEIKGVVEDPEMLLVMEYVPFGSLLVYLRTYKNRLAEQELLKFAADVAEGMEYLGQKRIVHRDLAARNILVASKEGVKISDFGLAQMMGPKDYYRLKTNRDLPIRWYAPETMSKWCFTHKSDVWSYGVTLWEMFSFGEEPIIDGCKDEDLLETLESGKRLNCPNNCSVRIYSYLMKRCWDAIPEDRPSFTELLMEIQTMQR